MGFKGKGFKIFLFIGAVGLLLAIGRSGFPSGISNSSGGATAFGVWTQSSANKAKNLLIIASQTTGSGAEFGISWESAVSVDFGFEYDETNLLTNTTTQIIGTFARADVRSHERGGSPVTELFCVDSVGFPAPCQNPGWFTIGEWGMGVNGKKMRVQKYVGGQLVGETTADVKISFKPTTEPLPGNDAEGRARLVDRTNRTGFFNFTYDATGDKVIVTINQSHGLPEPGPSNALTLNKTSGAAVAGSGSILVDGVDLLKGLQQQTGSFVKFNGSSTLSGSEICGDGTCSSNESCSTCSADCGPCFVCGDGLCAPEEIIICYEDCHCGDNFCDTTLEDSNTCPGDCFCGDGACDSTEDLTTCPADCQPFLWQFPCSTSQECQDLLAQQFGAPPEATALVFCQDSHCDGAATCEPRSIGTFSCATQGDANAYCVASLGWAGYSGVCDTGAGCCLP